jgi:hypothetical protein
MQKLKKGVPLGKLSSASHDKKWGQAGYYYAARLNFMEMDGKDYENVQAGQELGLRLAYTLVSSQDDLELNHHE